MHFCKIQAPDPSTVRTLNTLKSALTMVKEHWKAKQEYNYACEQLKSIRQDLTVSLIKTSRLKIVKFLASVYFSHCVDLPCKVRRLSCLIIFLLR